MEKNIEPNKLVLCVDEILGDLKFEKGTYKKFENAIKSVFELIGYKARQPERETGKGPDNFVFLGSGSYLIIECKNGTITDTICKEDCNQLNGSFSWFKEIYKEEDSGCIPVMIHNSDVYKYDCSPLSQTRIMTPELLKVFKDNVRKFVVAITQTNNFNNVENINSIIKTYKLDKDSIIKEYTTQYRIERK